MLLFVKDSTSALLHFGCAASAGSVTILVPLHEEKRARTRYKLCLSGVNNKWNCPVPTAKRSVKGAGNRSSHRVDNRCLIDASRRSADVKSVQHRKICCCILSMSITLTISTNIVRQTRVSQVTYLFRVPARFYSSLECFSSHTSRFLWKNTVQNPQFCMRSDVCVIGRACGGDGWVGPRPLCWHGPRRLWC